MPASCPDRACATSPTAATRALTNTTSWPRRGVGVELLMPTMKAVLDLVDEIGRVPVEIIQRHVDLENLFAVAHLGGALDRQRVHRTTNAAGRPPAAPVRRTARAPRRPRCAGRRHNGCGSLRSADRWSACPMPTAPTPTVGTMMRLISSSRATSAACSPAAPPKLSSAKRSRIDAAAQRHQADAVGHLQIDHAVDAGGGLLPRQFQRCCDAVDRGFRRRAIERTLVRP